jgi:hypothetical protein
VPARIQRHTHDGIAGLEEREHHRAVRLRARMRLNVGELGLEQRPYAVDGERFDPVHVLAAAVVAPGRIALCIFVRQHRALRFHHCGRHDVFRSDKFDLGLLTAQLQCDLRCNDGIVALQAFGKEASVFVHRNTPRVSCNTALLKAAPGFTVPAML